MLFIHCFSAMVQELKRRARIGWRQPVPPVVCTLVITALLLSPGGWLGFRRTAVRR